MPYKTVRKMVKILIVDDSRFMRRVLRGILQKEGYSDIIEAGSGEEAIDKVRLEKPDLVMLDIIMEGKDGIETLQEIKKEFPETKVIMVSAVGQDAIIKKALDLGAEDYVVKPFEPSAVIEVVRKVLAIEESLKEVSEESKGN